MHRFKRSLDSIFGIKNVYKNREAWTHIIGGVCTVACLFLYVRFCGTRYEVSFGVGVFILVLLDICGAIWTIQRDYEWNDLSRFELRTMEAFRVVFLFIIPVLSFNQYLITDFGIQILVLILALPVFYLFPLTRAYVGRNNLYLMCLKTSLVLNLFVSMRTTFFGVCASVAIIGVWGVRRRHTEAFRLVARCLAAYLIYLTLCIVAIPRCDYSSKHDPCTMTEMECNAFRTFWEFQRNNRI